MKYLHLTDGTKIAYRDAGNGSPILLIHGWGVSGELFLPQIDAWSKDHRIIVPDLRGHGASRPFAAGDAFGLLANDIETLLQQLALENILLVGWSMGAMVAWDLLDRFGSERFAGLATLDMVPRILNDQHWCLGLRDGVDASVFRHAIEAMQADWPAYTRVFVPRMFARSRLAEDHDAIKITRDIAARNDAASMARLWVAMVEQDFRPALASIDLPALVIHGGQSRLYGSEAGRWIAASLPQGRYEDFPDSGHTPHMEEPEHFNQSITAFRLELDRNNSPKPENPAPAAKTLT